MDEFRSLYLFYQSKQSVSFLYEFVIESQLFAYFIDLIILMKRNDILWKATLEDLFDDFLRFFTRMLISYLI